MPHGVYQRKPETIQKLKEQMTAIGKGRKGKKYASTEPHAQPMEEMTPKPPEVKPENIENEPPNPIPSSEPIPVEPTPPTLPPEPTTPIPPPITPQRPLTGPEIRKMQEEGKL